MEHGLEINSVVCHGLLPGSVCMYGHTKCIFARLNCFLSLCSKGSHFSLRNICLPWTFSIHTQVTLQYLWEKEYQVLVFYHHPMALEVPFLWPGQMMPAPWANTTDPEKLVQFLQASVTDRRFVYTFKSLPCCLKWFIVCTCLGLLTSVYCMFSHVHFLWANFSTILF